MSDLIKTVRSTARGIATFGPRYIASIFSHSYNGRTKRIKTDWGFFYFRPGNSDISVYRQVFKAREYDLSRYPQFAKIQRRYEAINAEGARPLIIDAGANNGLSAVWFSLAYPKALIIAVEPDPRNAELCRMNTAGRDNITVVEAAIGSFPGFVKISSTDQAWAVQSARTEYGAIKIVTAPDLARVAGENAQPFICKIDIEGFERDLFNSHTQWIENYAVLIIEPHEWMDSMSGSSVNFQKSLAGWGQLLISGENLVYVNGRLAEHGNIKPIFHPKLRSKA